MIVDTDVSEIYTTSKERRFVMLNKSWYDIGSIITGNDGLQTDELGHEMRMIPCMPDTYRRSQLWISHDGVLRRRYFNFMHDRSNAGY